MARESDLRPEEHVRRGVARTLRSGLLLLVLLGALGAWLSLGAFTLAPGQAAVLLRLGRHAGTITEEGFHLVLPPPIVLRQIVNAEQVRTEDFGHVAAEGAALDKEAELEAAMQTADNNIVRIGFSVQYRTKDSFAALYRVEDPVAVVRDAAQAAMREAVGAMTVDGVLREQRDALTADVARELQTILDTYDAGIDIVGVQLRDVQAPAQVRAAFDDVIAATQDASRLVNEAEGYRNEVLPGARAQAAELTAAADAHRQAVVAEATGEAARFRAIVAEYRKAPAVTEKRLYLETMEQVLPKVEKVIIERGTTSVVPYLPIGREPGERKREPVESTREPREKQGEP
ncbi:MAG TPA: FtsH protease activity modulator HflK [Myxococcota bacterium]|nr:FtsH protease activity modulator HflK [Myxococcota bacterium]